MSAFWLANLDPASAWAHFSWQDFAENRPSPHAVVILPIHGIADHGLGLPLDAEEIVGTHLARLACENARATVDLRVLPPLRVGPAPYPHTFFGIDPETAHDHIREIASAVRAAGFGKLVFFVSSPWHKEFIDAASRDVRVEFGLQTFLIHLSGLGLDFHPASDRRGEAQAAVAFVQGQPARPTTRPAEIFDATFRPGNFRQAAPLSPNSSHDGRAIVQTAADHLTRLLGEIAARKPLGGDAQMGSVRLASAWANKTFNTITSDAPQLFAGGYRSRYLPALTRGELEAWPDKERTLVIVPIGAIEQHGPHLPVGVDAMLGQAWLAHALPRLPSDARVLVAPPITYGKSNEHLDFPGTVSVSGKTLRRLLHAYATQLHALGFHHLAILNTHGGNSAVIVYTLRELQTSPGLRAGMLNIPFKPDISAQEREYGFHAGEWETSLLLAIAPEFVRMEKAVCEYPARIDDPGQLRPENAPAIFSWTTADISRSGVMGDATLATPDKGAHWLDAASTVLAQRIVELLP